MRALPSETPVRLVPGRLAVDAPSGIRERFQTLGCDLCGAVLANAIAALGDPGACVLGLDRILVETLVNPLRGRSIGHDLGVVGYPESFAHRYDARLIPIARRRLFS